MQQDNNLLNSVFNFFVPIHPDGHKFLIITFLVALLGFLIWEPLGWLSAAVGVWIGYFFRDPDRMVPLRDGLIVSPADGRITSIEKVRPSADLQLGEEERVRISVFLSIFDVHINRAPFSGRIKYSKYIKGAFLNAALDKSSDENERQLFVIENNKGLEIGLVQIAGLIARRIVTSVKVGDQVGVGERVGLIRFGSRVDTYLPPRHSPLVTVGQTAIAGETIFADLQYPRTDQNFKKI